MAKYDDTKFYWLQLKEDFFDEGAIDWLEEQPNGKEYSLFYLKLCLKSLRTNGILERHVGSIIVPYDYKKLAEITKTNPDTVLIALDLLIKLELIEKLDTGALYMKEVANMIGSQSIGAFKKQQQRELARNKKLLLGEGVDGAGTNVHQDVHENIEIEKELELEQDIDIEDNVAIDDNATLATKDETLADGNTKVERSKAKKWNPPYFTNPDVEAAFIDLLEMRKKLKAPNSDRALTMLMNTLTPLSDDMKLKVINKSILNGWKSVYPESVLREQAKVDGQNVGKNGVLLDGRKTDILDDIL